MYRVKIVSSFLYALALTFTVVAQEQGLERWENTIQKFEQQDAQTPVAPGAILFTGSSSIAMWQDISDYFPDQRIINRGFGGSQFSHGRKKFRPFFMF